MPSQETQNKHSDNIPASYQKILDQFSSDFQANKLHHAYLISGLEGSGKENLCRKIASDILYNQAEAKNRAAFSDLNNHPDFLNIIPDPESKRQEITVKQAREITKFLSLNANIGTYRVIIINSIDNLNLNAANALLKILEEPPNDTIFLIISHNNKKILATIKSRCCEIRLPKLTNSEIKDNIKAMNIEFTESQITEILEICPYQPTQAAHLLKNDALEIYKKLLDLNLNLDLKELQKFLDSQKLKTNTDKFDILSLLINQLFYRIIKAKNLSKSEQKLSNKLTKKHSFVELVGIISQFNDKAQNCKQANLDRNYFITNFLINLH
jgi:DNA polymerase III subunit delta'